MPEGDTIHRAAAALRTALTGRVSTRFDAPRLYGPHPGPGRTIESVESHGKHLEISWDDGIVLHTHLRMNGSWHLYRIGERWRKPTDQMRVAIEVPDWVAVCFNAPNVETYRKADKRRHPGMGRLGPDLCKPDTDLGAVVNLLLGYPDPSARLGEVLLDQRVLCGVGNVYRSELCFRHGIDPRRRGVDLDRDTVEELLALGRLDIIVLDHDQHPGHLVERQVGALGFRGGVGAGRCQADPDRYGQAPFSRFTEQARRGAESFHRGADSTCTRGPKGGPRSLSKVLCSVIVAVSPKGPPLPHLGEAPCGSPPGINLCPGPAPSGLA